MNAAWISRLPEGQLGTAAIVRFRVSESASAITAMRGDYVPPGEYTRLEINGLLMMSDTPNEWRMHYEFLRRATGHVLINGLGMGCCLQVALSKDDVTHVTVVESNPDVVAIVAPHFPDADIICADAFDWKPPQNTRYNAAWHDIWPDICSGNLPDMHRLHRKYGRRVDWQGSWSRPQLEARRRRERRDD